MNKTVEACNETHPGFTIICDKCGSKEIYTEDSTGYSEESGAWGSYELVCNKCGNRCSIYEP